MERKYILFPNIHKLFLKLKQLHRNYFETLILKKFYLGKKAEGLQKQ